MKWGIAIQPSPALSGLTITHIPSVDGYWEEALETFQLCIESFCGSTPVKRDLTVFDNGSCQGVVEFLRQLRDRGVINSLIESDRNVGKVNAWNTLFSLCLAETVVYFDSDVLFLPGWYEESRRVLERFPEAATVTAQPIPGSLSMHCNSTLNQAGACSDVKVIEGDDLIPCEFVDSHRRGLGVSAADYQTRLADRRDVLLRRGETEAYVSSSHFQFMGPREALARFFPLSSVTALGDDRVFDECVDASGGWRLSTVNYLVHHLGNRVPDLAVELPWWSGNLAFNAAVEKRATHLDPRGFRSRLKRRIASSLQLRRILKVINRFTYEWLYPRP